MKFNTAEEILVEQFPEMKGKVQWPKTVIHTSVFIKLKRAVKMSDKACLLKDVMKKYKQNYLSKKWDVAPPKEYFAELFRISKNQIIWGGNYFELPASRGIICWDKQQMMQTFSRWEYAWTSFDCVARMFERRSQEAEGIRFHPTQKPVALYEWLLTNYAKQGDKILDTHLGSGSSRIAAYNLGFDFVGCEIDKEYFEKQEERFAKHTAQTSLFIDGGF